MSKKYNNQRNFNTSENKTEDVEKVIKGKVNCSLLNIRESNNKESKIVSVVGLDDVLTIVEKIEDWYKVELKETKGYCMSKFIDLI